MSGRCATAMSSNTNLLWLRRNDGEELSAEDSALADECDSAFDGDAPQPVRLGCCDTLKSGGGVGSVGRDCSKR